MTAARIAIIVGALVAFGAFALAAVLLVSNGPDSSQRLAELFALFGGIVTALIGALRADMAATRAATTASNTMQIAANVAASTAATNEMNAKLDTMASLGLPMNSKATQPKPSIAAQAAIQEAAHRHA